MDSCLPSFAFACTANSVSTYASDMVGYERREYISWIESSERVCRYVEMTAWTGMLTVKVAMAVDAPAVVELMMQRLMADDY